MHLDCETSFCEVSITCEVFNQVCGCSCNARVFSLSYTHIYDTLHYNHQDELDIHLQCVHREKRAQYVSIAIYDQHVCSSLFGFFVFSRIDYIKIRNEKHEKSTIMSSAPKATCAEVAYVLHDYERCFRWFLCKERQFAMLLVFVRCKNM